jgi:hypothetical protein
VSATTGEAAPCPRFYLERLVARRWGVPPWVVEQAEAAEVEDELRIMQLEAEAAAAG